MLTEDEREAADRLGRSLARAMPPYRGVPDGHLGRWRPCPTKTVSAWSAHVEAYNWLGEGLEPVSCKFSEIGRRLQKQTADRYRAAAEVFSWGFPGQELRTDLPVIDAVVETARALALNDEPTDKSLPPWSAFWTKVACAATFDLDLAESATPQAIWDSRVATATCLVLTESNAAAADIAVAQMVLKVPPPRANSGARRRAFLKSRRGWTLCYQSTSAFSRWRSQAFGSLVLSACARELNRTRVGDRANWTSFEVGAALFVEGY